jgi:hypothetical protein
MQWFYIDIVIVFKDILSDPHIPTFLLLRQKKSSKRKGDFFAIAPRQKKGSTLWSQFAIKLGGAGFQAISYLYSAFYQG